MLKCNTVYQTEKYNVKDLGCCRTIELSCQDGGAFSLVPDDKTSLTGTEFISSGFVHYLYVFVETSKSNILLYSRGTRSPPPYNTDDG